MKIDKLDLEVVPAKLENYLKMFPQEATYLVGSAILIAKDMIRLFPGGAILQLRLKNDDWIETNINGHINSHIVYYVYIHSGFAILPQVSKEPIPFLTAEDRAIIIASPEEDYKIQILSGVDYTGTYADSNYYFNDIDEFIRPSEVEPVRAIPVIQKSNIF